MVPAYTLDLSVEVLREWFRYIPELARCCRETRISQHQQLHLSTFINHLQELVNKKFHLQELVNIFLAVSLLLDNPSSNCNLNDQ